MSTTETEVRINYAPMMVPPPSISVDLGAVWSRWTEAWTASTGRTPVAYLSCGTESSGTIALEWPAARKIEAALEPHSDRSVDLLLRVRAGNLPAASHLSHFLTNVVEDLRVVVVDWCSSAGSLLAASASSICMENGSYMGSLCPQVRDISSNDTIGVDIASVLTEWLQAHGDAAEVLAASPHLSIRQMGRALQWTNEVGRSLEHSLGKRGYDEAAIGKIRALLLDPLLPHDAPLFSDRLRQAGLRISDMTPTEANAVRSLCVDVAVDELLPASQGGMRGALLMGVDHVEQIDVGPHD